MNEERQTFFDKYGKYIMGFIAAWFAYAYYLSMNEPKSSKVFIPSQVNDALYDYGYNAGMSFSQNGFDSSACVDFDGDIFTGCLAGVSFHEQYLREN